MKHFKSNLNQAVRVFPILLVMLLLGSTAFARAGWSNTSMSARQSNADELSDRQPSSAWQPSYQGYQSQIFEVGTTNVPSDYSEISSESSGSHKVGPRKLGGGTDVGEQSENSPIGEPWILLLFALLACGVIAYRRMNFRHNKNMKNTILNQLFLSCKKWKTLVLISTLLTLGVGQMWGAKGFFTDGQWNVAIYYGSGSDTWGSGYGNASTYALGVQTDLYLKNCWVKTWSNDSWTQSKVVWYYGWSSGSTTNNKTATKSSVQGNQTWDFSTNYNLISNAPNNPGENTLWMYWRLDDYVSSGNSKITFTIPGFKSLSSTSVTFDNTTVGNNNSKSITYTHYGTAPTNVAERYSITGTNADQFSITALNGTGATIKFTPTSAGTKTATLVINDVHGKTTGSITLTGVGTAPTVPTLILNSVSPTELISGNDVTITTTCSNTSNAISFEYTTNNGTTWNSLTPKSTTSSGQVAVWTIPEAHGATQTYKFRAKITADALTTDASSDVTVYGKKSIWVRNSKLWSSFKVYCFNEGVGEEVAWPGNSTRVVETSGTWKQIVLSSQYAGFILNDGSSQTPDLAYADYTDGGCYAINLAADGNSKYPLPTSTVDCKPSGYSGYSLLYGNDGKNGDGGTDASFAMPWAFKDFVTTSGTTSQVTFAMTASDIGKVYEFKIYGNNNLYGYKAASGGKIESSISNQTMNASYGNARMCITVPGTYKITFNSTGTKLSVTYPDGNYIRGDFNSWGWDNALTPTGNTNEYSCTISLTGANAEKLWSPTKNGFKVVIGGVHYGKNSTIISASSNSAASCSTSGSNIGFATTIGGNYTFTYNTSSNTITVGYPTVTAMTGTVGLSVSDNESVDGTDGTSSHPYYAFAGGSLTLDKSHTNGPSTNSHFKYSYYKGSKGGSTATTEITTKVSTGTTSYSYDVGSTAGKYPMKVDAYWEYGPDGYKAKGTTQSSGIKYYQVLAVPTVSLTSDKVSIKEGTDASFTLTATPSNITSGLAGVTYKFFKGNSTADANRISTVTKTAANSTQPATCNVTPTYDNNTNSWTYTVQMTYLSKVVTTTVTVYRKWDIYVDDVCSWGTLKLYMWDSGGSYPIASPGASMPKITGSTHWYVVTLDTRYPSFRINKQNGTESNTHTASISTYQAGTYWYLNNCQTLTKLTLSDPTVSLSASIANCKDITLTGDVTNFGGDGSSASKMKNVKFIVAGSDQAATTVSTSDGTFTKALTNATAGATNTLQAYVENIHGSATSSVLHYTNVTLDRQGATTGSTAVTAVESMAMPAGATAPEKEGFKFGGYYAEEGGSGKQYYNASMESVNTWDQTDQNKTIYAKWTPLVTFDVYFYNKDNWSTPKAYIWNSVGNRHKKDWPGEAMTLHQSKIYKVQYESADDYNMIQFNDGTSSHKYDNLSLPAYNQAFYNPGANEWTQYIMVADFPTTKQAAAVGAKISIEPVVAWADGISFQQISITATRDSGSTAITASVAGTKLIVTGTAAGTAKYTITYRYSTTTITKVIRFQYLEGLTVQAKIATDDSKWTDDSKVKIHFWGTGIANSDIPMTFAKSEDGYNYFQAIIPKGTDGKANFLFFYDYMEDTNANRWRQTANQTNVTAEKCYTIAYAGSTSTKSNCTSTAGLCADSWQVRIVMGSGNIYTSNAVAGNTEVISFFAPGESESQSYRQGTVTLEHNGATVATLAANTFSSSGVYTAKVKTSSPYGLTDLALYTGDYYIRTDGAAGRWDNYKTNPDNLMTEFTRNTNFPNETFSYYWVKNVAKNKTENIKATVANDYNPVLCNFTADETANATDGVNLRFGYEPTTNEIVRGIVGGSTTNNFLNIICADGSLVYKEIDCSTLLDETRYSSNPGDSKFQDKSNWVYEVIVYAKIDASHPVANVVLKSYYNGINYLLGMVKDSYGRETSTPVSFPVIKTGTTNGIYGLRVVYDFKTNRLFAAWAPADRVIDGVLDVDADVMFLRHEDGDAAQISFKTNASRIEDIKQAIFALELDNEKVDHGGSGNIERHYFISLPFDCKVSNIFGIGGFMNYWGIQRYNGAKRAQIGWFQETPTFWEWLSPDDVMRAGEGYLLSVDKKALENGGVWKDGIIYQKQEVIINPETSQPYKAQDGSDSIAWVTHDDGSMLTMYFPSTTSGFTITPATGESLTITYPDQPCSITRDDRDKKDSNWKCIGTPGYKNVEITKYSQASPELVVNAAPRFLYEFHEQTTGATWAKGTYTVTDGSEFTYHSFHSYMVQFAGTIDWAQYSKGDVAPSPIAPKRMPTADTKITKVEIELLSSDDDALDRTFVWLQENATIGFDQNYDLNKMTQKNANQIYSYAENNVSFAANVLPLETDTVQLVVNIANEGEFTFSLNNDKHVGMAPVLYDMYKSEQINLLNSDYLVELEKGKYEDRFFLLFQPEAPIVTNFETTADGGQNVHSSEAIYDVLGRRVNTIYPGHLYIVNGEKRIAK